MAVVTVKSGAITNRDASPRVATNASISRGVLKEAVGTAEGASGDSIASKYIMAQVPSNARISRVLLSNDAISTAGATDVGVYRTTADGGAVVVAAAFASAVVLTSAQVNVDVTHEADPTDGNANDFGLADTEKPLWQVLNLAADPKVQYDIVLTLTAALGGAGTLGLKVQYVE